MLRTVFNPIFICSRQYSIRIFSLWHFLVNIFNFSDFVFIFVAFEIFQSFQCRKATVLVNPLALWARKSCWNKWWNWLIFSFTFCALCFHIVPSKIRKKNSHCYLHGDSLIFEFFYPNNFSLFKQNKFKI